MDRRSFLAASAGCTLTFAARGARAQTATEMVIAPLSGPDAASLYYAQQEGWFRQAGLDLAIGSLRDFNGKTVAVPSLSDLITISVRGSIDQSGGDSAAVHFVEMPPAAMVGALQAQRIDAAGLYEPFLSAPLAQGGRPIGKPPYNSVAPKFQVEACFAYGPWTAAHRDAVVAFATVIDRAAGYTDAHFRDLIPMIAQFSHILPEVLAKMQFAMIAPTLDPAMIQPVINAAAKYHAIPRVFPAKELIFGAG